MLLVEERLMAEAADALRRTGDWDERRLALHVAAASVSLSADLDEDPDPGPALALCLAALRR